MEPFENFEYDKNYYLTFNTMGTTPIQDDIIIKIDRGF